MKNLIIGEKVFSKAVGFCLICLVENKRENEDVVKGTPVSSAWTKVSDSGYNRITGSIFCLYHCFRTCCPSVRPSPLFKSRKQNNRKQCSLLARLWVWPSGSLMIDTCLVSYYILYGILSTWNSNNHSFYILCF